MKILLTGATGLLGSHIKEALLEGRLYTKIVGISRKARHLYEDHPDKEKVNHTDCENEYIECYGNLEHDCTRLITQYKPEVIIHCAGVATPSFSAKSLLAGNVQTTFNLLEASKDLGVQFVYASSIVLENLPFNQYCASKASAEAFIRSYTECYNMKAIVIRPCAIVGKNTSHGLLHDVVRKLQSSDKELTLRGNYPGSVKPFLYAPQLAQVIVNLTKDVTDKHFRVTICPNDSLSVATVAHAVMHELNLYKPIQWDETTQYKDDQKYVYGVCGIDGIMPSLEAIKLATRDILEESK